MPTSTNPPHFHVTHPSHSIYAFGPAPHCSASKKTGSIARLRLQLSLILCVYTAASLQGSTKPPHLHQCCCESCHLLGVCVQCTLALANVGAGEVGLNNLGPCSMRREVEATRQMHVPQLQSPSCASCAWLLLASTTVAPAARKMYAQHVDVNKSHAFAALLPTCCQCINQLGVAAAACSNCFRAVAVAWS
jgi:hypothetical protein